MIFVLLASVLFTPSSDASVNNALLVSSMGIVHSASEDVAFLHRNVPHCTRFADSIEQQLVAPIAQDLAAFEARLDRYTNVPPRSCTARADLDFILGTIDQKLTMATAPQSQLMGMTGDEAMTKALSADPSHPDCRAEDPRDPRSTRELKTYRALKLKLIALRASVASLKADTDCAKRE